MTVTGDAGKFTGLNLGWYLVDSTAGALCGLTTTDPDASINAKNGTPTVDKQVQEDLTGMWGDTNTADIGQVVNYMTIIHVAAGAENYVLHDAMSEGLTFEHDLDEGRGVTEIKHVNSAGVETTLVAGQDYTVKTAEFGDDCDFEVIFSDEFVATLKANDRLLVYYNAMLNRNAEIGTADGNPMYRRAREDEEGVSIKVVDGKVTVVGFDNGVYYLEETVAPSGYNKLTARKEFTIADKNLDSIFNDGIYSTGSGVHVVNKTGSMLPETGGMGTVLFIAIGAVAVLGTGVVLVTKKRMSMVQD